MTIETWNAALFHKTELLLGEGAFWHAEWERFLYVDIEGRKVGCIDADGRNAEEKVLNERVGTVVPADNNQLVVALQSSIQALNFKSGKLTELIKIEADKLNNRCNDGKCDAAGRLWIGTMSTDGKLKQGALYCFDGSLQLKLDNISISNGICWSKDNTIMYYIDSYDYNIKAYDFDLSTGNISKERIVAAVKEPDCLPDGMTIDNDGMLWVAMWGGCCIYRYNPANGTLIGKIAVPAPNVTSCAFGGTDMQTLFITTARTGLNETQLQQYPLSGSLFYADLGIEGFKMNGFALSK